MTHANDTVQSTRLIFVKLGTVRLHYILWSHFNFGLVRCTFRVYMTLSPAGPSFQFFDRSLCHAYRHIYMSLNSIRFNGYFTSEPNWILTFIFWIPWQVSTRLRVLCTLNCHVLVDSPSSRSSGSLCTKWRKNVPLLSSSVPVNGNEASSDRHRTERNHLLLLDGSGITYLNVQRKVIAVQYISCQVLAARC
jgi:hypothetical protein